MPNLTPSDVRNVAFKKPPLGKRGYDEEQVDAFLDAVERTIVALTEEIASLRAQLRGVPQPSVRNTSNDPGGAVLGELEQIKARLARLEAAFGSGMPEFPKSDPLFGTRG